MDFELAKQNLEQLKASLILSPESKEKNEATTRLHLIDTMIVECLGWPRQTIEAERYNNGEFSDYELGSPQKRIVLEAKREGIYFELPAGFEKSKCALKTICSLDSEIDRAIRQVMSYCNNRGIPIAVVSNGRQYIIFMSNRQDGIPPMDGMCLVFSSLDDIASKFALFWNSLSCNGVTQNRIVSLLGATSVIPAPDKLSSKIVNYPGFKNRNPIAAELQILGGLFLEDIGQIPQSEEEFVKATYCESDALSQYALVSKEILSTRYTSYFQKETRTSVLQARTKKGIEPELKKDLFAAGLSRRPIILVGDVGVGKSMFIKHLLLVDAKEALQNTIVIYVDFGSKPTFAKEIDHYVVTEIAEQLLGKYGINIEERNFVRGVYNKEIERFGKGIYADYKTTMPEKFKEKEIEFIQSLMGSTDDHLKACIKHLVSGRQKQVVIFLDNVDQRPYEFQEKVFLISQSLAETWPVVAFVALRPDTFTRSKTKGSIAAYQPRVFTIGPPRVDRVIQKRLAYALDQLKTLGIISSKNSDIRIDSNTLEKYIEMLLKTFSEQNDIIGFVDNMSNGNLRKAIEYIGIFVGSAHVDSKKILSSIKDRGAYNLPIHEFLRSLIYKDNEYFNPDDSVLINVYDISSDNPKEHFILLIILSILEKMGKPSMSEGFVSSIEIYKHLQPMGYTEIEIESALARCLENSLVAAPGYEEGVLPERIRILPAGAYTLIRLACMFTYVDSIIVDTPITIHEFRAKIHDVQTIEDRIDRVAVFLEYLENAWSGAKNDFFDWSEYAGRIRREMHNVQYSARTKAAQKNQGH